MPTVSSALGYCVYVAFSCLIPVFILVVSVNKSIGCILIFEDNIQLGRVSFLIKL